MDELKPLPCPFCGEESRIWCSASSRYWVVCRNPDCRAEGPVDLSESGAIEKWNAAPRLYRQENSAPLYCPPGGVIPGREDTMRILIEFNGEQEQGTAYKAGDGILIHLTNFNAPNALPFDALFKGLPEGKLNGGFVEVGEWDAQKKEFPFEAQISFGVGPDGKVYSQICASPDELPPDQP